VSRGFLACGFACVHRLQGRAELTMWLVSPAQAPISCERAGWVKDRAGGRAAMPRR
jgi:hypothetical protein